MRGASTDLLDIAGALHSGVADPDSWRLGLDGLSDVLGGAGFMLISLIAGRAGYVVEGHRIPDAAVEIASGPLAVPDPAINPWYAAVPRLGRQRLVTLDDIGGRAVAEQSRAWQEGMAPNGLVPGIGAILERLPERIDINMVYRAPGAPDHDSGQRAAYMRIVPHLARALRVRHEIEATRALAASAIDALDALNRGVVLTAPDGSIRFANRAAEAILSEEDGLQSRRGKLTAVRSREASHLRALVHNAAQTSIGSAMAAVDACAVQRPSGRAPYAVVAEPLAPAHNARLGHPARHGSILFIADAEKFGRPAPARLAMLYALTATEAEIASRLAHGDRIAQVAAALGISENTVKTHQKAVFEKIGVNRQTQLVRRVAADVGDIRA
jgi:DNA-binding CsgD family transcriptional regulator/PAS domain-containing protein